MFGEVVAELLGMNRTDMRVLVELAPLAFETAVRVYEPIAEGFKDQISAYSDKELALILAFFQRGRIFHDEQLERVRGMLRAKHGKDPE
ncbi:MAG TPA: hypothetical protein VGG08_10530 [Solirubrobacteraceae bacterium]